MPFYLMQHQIFKGFKDKQPYSNLQIINIPIIYCKFNHRTKCQLRPANGLSLSNNTTRSIKPLPQSWKSAK